MVRHVGSHMLRPCFLPQFLCGVASVPGRAAHHSTINRDCPRKHRIKHGNLKKKSDLYECVLLLFWHMVRVLCPDGLEWAENCKLPAVMSLHISSVRASDGEGKLTESSLSHADPFTLSSHAYQ
ncbi:hypothetical protein CY34DRAFT_386570 [Suillus luteus UH-Slu-Lm8-n1]|uniref:Uncharacterized protein n=1 Tax=Suillus luteus UH-Slu-Lm8-n1 TaxID=930992 RepID=A0A0D0AKC8_9AGAM|nr:hypothetical protein CY34DRAFT_386570 [Suillus luteus UH-Slu-Lm8-n1]